MKTILMLFKYIFLGALMVGVATLAGTGVWVSKRINEPMTLPAAQGLTFRQFWLERMEYFENYEKQTGARPGACTGTAKLFAWGDAAFAAQYALSKAVPEGSFFDRMTVKDNTYKRCAPKHEVTAETFLPSAWNSFECYEWMVLAEPHGGSCRTTYVDFEAARQK